MKLIKILPIVMVSVLLGSTVTLASERGTTSADFLKIGLGANSAGMGEAFTAQYGDVNTMFYNPAGLVDMEMNRISATHLNWIAETQYEALAYARPIIGVGTLGVGFVLLHMPEIPGLDINGAETGMLQVYDLAVQFSYARDISPFVGLKGLNAGASMKIIHRKLADVSASGIAVDLGALYQIDNNLSVGLACRNLGYLSSFDVAGEQLPVIIRAGAGYRAELASDHKVTTLLDLVKSSDNDFRANLGLEYTFARIVSLRAGYKMGYDTDGFQAGAGVAWQNITVDYAIKLMDTFGLTHFVSASVGFGTTLKSLQSEEIKKMLQEAEALYSQSKYQESLQVVKKAILINAKNKRAIKLCDKLKTVMQMLEMPLGNETPTIVPEEETGNLTPDEIEELGKTGNQEEQQ